MESETEPQDGFDAGEPPLRGSVGDGGAGTPAVDGDAAGDGAPEPPRPSRGAAWLAMGAVAAALFLVFYLSPGAGHDDAEHASDAALIGMNAPLHFTLKDMNGVDVKLA